MAREISRKKTPEDFVREWGAEEAADTKGRLKIFLGYASGVGKSFRMLDEARRRRERGQDLGVGAVQPQGPPGGEAPVRGRERRGRGGRSCAAAGAAGGGGAVAEAGSDPSEDCWRRFCHRR